ncbi:MAG: ion transporter [Micavibrio aeruginosavorus]|uniref:Ion transporter n=1 Tax=Micavibrio aeruginosavorus TaxID=349221 RepID=A0A7T5R4H5_9BACT|nr:MAG: ion transporter [Micavibrio aeruginosavorus]
MLRLQAFLEHRNFTIFITGLILLNAVLLGVETDDSLRQAYGAWFHKLDQLILGVFVAELGARLAVYRLAFFRSGWNWFDLIVVSICLIPASGPLAVLRALRVFRVLRLLSVVPSLRRVISALLRAIPGMTSILSVLLIIYYVAAVLATHIFGHSDDSRLEALFGSIGKSMFTLFQIMTLEGWSEGIAQPAMAVYPWSWVFFVAFIIITSFAVLNLFIGVIVDAMNIIHEEEGRGKEDASLQLEIKLLRADIEQMRRVLSAQKGN